MATFTPAHAFEGPADRPWKIHQTARAFYPPRLMQSGVRQGEARVRISIGADGQLLDALVIAHTHREFGEEALRTVRQWRYDPARVKGEAIGVVGDVTFDFVINGTVAIVDPSSVPKVDWKDSSERFVYKPEGLKRLDRIPTPTHVVPPVYPQEWSDRGIRGSATVEFYIDEAGQARIPVVTAADHPLLGASAAAAVAQWRFEPPTCQGRRVLAHIEQVFAFQPEKK